MTGFGKYVGPIWRLPDGDDGNGNRFALLVAENHMNAAGSVHGGMLMTLADGAMSRAARMASGGKGCSTVSLNCDFVSPGRLGDLIEAQVRVTRTSRSMVFVSAELVAAGRILLVATGLWKILDA